MAGFLFDGDLDTILENVPPTAQARVLVDHFDSVASAFLAEFELMSPAEARAALGFI